MDSTAKGCKCPCHKMLGLLIALIGVAFLLEHYGVITRDVLDVAWPVLVILIGLKKAFKGFCKCCPAAASGN